MQKYQQQVQRPCTIIGVGLDHRFFKFEEDEKDPNFQHIFWNLGQLNVNETFHSDGRSFIFSTGCTIFVTTGLVIKAAPRWFKFVEYNINTQFWIVYGPYIPSYLKWPTVYVGGPGKASLHCPYETKARQVQGLTAKSSPPYQISEN